MTTTQAEKKGTYVVTGTGVIITCPSCSQRNRVGFNRLAAKARCGTCHTELAHPGEPLEVTEAATFDALVAQSSLPVVVDFWAPWCGPCRMVAPEIARVASANAGRYLVIKVNTDEVADLGERLGIRSIPTMAVFANGREFGRTAGARPAKDIEAFVSGALARGRDS